MPGKFSALTVSFLISLGFASADTQTRLSDSDLTPLIQTDWSGTLTYLNYQEPFIDFTIPTALEVSEASEGLDLLFKYPGEEHKNSSYLMRYSIADNTFDQNPISDILRGDQGAITIVTQFACEDMGKPAKCEMRYALSDRAYTQTKYVTYVASGERIRRNEYSFKR